MASHFFDDIAVGIGAPRQRIVGRPGQGQSFTGVILEEPGEPVQMHFAGGNMFPHFRTNCPHCVKEQLETKGFYYLGCWSPGVGLGILELSLSCYRSCAAAACRDTTEIKEVFSGSTGDLRFRGLVVQISRGGFKNSPRVLRVQQRLGEARLQEWPLRTREELARIWGVPIRPRLRKVSE